MLTAPANPKTPSDSALSQPPRHQLSAGSGQNLGSAPSRVTQIYITFNPAIPYLRLHPKGINLKNEKALEQKFSAFYLTAGEMKEPTNLALELAGEHHTF